MNQRFRKPDMATELIRVILSNANDVNSDNFVSHIANDFAADIQVKLYDFMRAMICCWAGGEDLSHEDAAVIEDCRKICDLMGWQAENIKY